MSGMVPRARRAASVPTEQRVGEPVRVSSTVSSTVGRPGSGSVGGLFEVGCESPPIRPFARSLSGLLDWFGVCVVGARAATRCRSRSRCWGSARCPAAASRGRCPGSSDSCLPSPVPLPPSCAAVSPVAPVLPKDAKVARIGGRLGDPGAAAASGRSSLPPRRSAGAPAPRAAARRGRRPGTTDSRSVRVAMLAAVKSRSSAIELAFRWRRSRTAAGRRPRWPAR